MARWWSIPALIAAPVVVHLGAAPAAASIHCNVTIIMTTLGTDGEPAVYSGDAVLTPVTSDGATMVDPATSTVKPTTSPATSSGTVSPATNSGVPSGASENPTVDSPAVPSTTDTGSIPVPSSDGTSVIDDGPVAPPPPVLEPGQDTTVTEVTTSAPIETAVPVTTTEPIGEVPNGDPLADNTSAPTVADTPEPGTLTLMGLGLAGGFRFLRRKRS